MPTAFFAALLAMIVAYLVLVEIGKHVFYAAPRASSPTRRSGDHHLRRRAAYFTSRDHLLPPVG